MSRVIRWLGVIAALAAAVAVLVTAPNDGDHGLETFLVTVLLATAWWIMRPPRWGKSPR